MAYNLHGPSSTLSPSERSQEARRILRILESESEEDLSSKLTVNALSFLRDLWLRESMLPRGGELLVTDAQLYFLRDIKDKFD